MEALSLRLHPGGTAKNICWVVEGAMKEAGLTFEDLDAIAVTYAPGLIGALLVGVN